MFKTIIGVCIGLALGLTVTLQGLAAEKIKFATPVKAYPVFYLPVLAAEEGGIWKENGLEVEWVPFQGGNPMHASVAAGSIDIGVCMGSAAMQAIAQGHVPMVFISDFYAPDDFVVWVRPGDRFKKPEDLKGAKIGVSRFGGAEHAYARAIVRALHLENEVQYISTGGITASIASLKAGVIDVTIQPPEIMINLKMSGEVREFLHVADYLPKEWADDMLFTTKDYLKSNPDVVRRVVKATLQALDYIRKNPEWTMNKMKSMSGYSDQAAKEIYEREIKRFTTDGKINPRAIGNVETFLIDYGIISKEKAPALKDLYSAEITGLVR